MPSVKMMIRVVSDGMPCLLNAVENIRIPDNIFANHEKSCAGIVPSQDVKHLRCRFRNWTIIEGEVDDLIRTGYIAGKPPGTQPTDEKGRPDKFHGVQGS
jgi:hypothetical protein